MARRHETVRVSLRLSKEAKARLDDVSERTEAGSPTEVVRRALALYDALLDQKEQGRKVILRDDDGTEREVMLLF